MNRHHRRGRAKARTGRLPPPGSDDYKVLRALVAQMPVVHRVAAQGRITVPDAVDRMLQLIEQGYVRLYMYADGGLELVATDRFEGQTLELGRITAE